MFLSSAATAVMLSVILQEVAFESIVEVATIFSRVDYYGLRFAGLKLTRGVVNKILELLLEDSNRKSSLFGLIMTERLLFV